MTNKHINNLKLWPIFFVPKKLKEITKNVSYKTSKYLCSVKNNVFYKLEENWVGKNLVIEEIGNSENISNEEFYDIILDKIIFFEKKWIKIDNIDVSKVLKKEEKQNSIKKNSDSITKWNIILNNTKKNIHKTLSDNFPILSTGRIKKNHNVVNIRFWWIKKINDNISKEFTDFLIESIANKLEENFREKNETIKPNYNRWRKVSGDYKNLLFSLPDEFDISKDLFWEKDINIFIEKIIDNLDDENFTKLLKNNNLNLKNWENKKEVAKKFILDNFYIWIWKHKNKSSNIKLKNESIYKAISASKEKINKNIKQWINKYEFRKIQKISKKMLKLENECIRKHKDNSFSYDGETEHRIIVNINWENHINEILINRIKKDKKIVFHPENIWNDFKKKITEYNEIWNKWFYFLMPTLDIEKSEEIFEELNKSVKKWIIKTEYFTKNYKWFYAKKYLEKYSKWEKWLKIFIDIIWNWTLNFKSFKEIAKNVNSWEISINNIDKLLNACNNITKDTIKIIKNFLEKNPNSIINITWDEIFIFIPWVNIWEEKNIINNISKNFHDNNLKARFISSFDNDISFNNLDFLTYINKFFEEKLENTKFWLNKNIILNIDDELKKDILFKEQYLNNLDTDNTYREERFKDFLTNKNQTSYIYMI